jgi:hypothetical protein
VLHLAARQCVHKTAAVVVLRLLLSSGRVGVDLAALAALDNEPAAAEDDYGREDRVVTARALLQPA